MCLKIFLFLLLAVAQLLLSVPKSIVLASVYFRICFCYKGRSINKLQNGIILLIFKIWKIWNIGFVNNIILNSSFEFYYDDVTVTSFVNDKYGDATAGSIPYRNSVMLFIFCGPNAIHSEIRPVYSDKCFTWPDMFDVRSLLVDEKALLMKKDLADVLFWWLMQWSQQSHLSNGLISMCH